MQPREISIDIRNCRWLVYFFPEHGLRPQLALDALNIPPTVA